MDRTLTGQVAIVTGGGKGLGRAFAIHLAELGAAVVVNNRNRVVDARGWGPADHVVAEIVGRGGSAIADYGDVAEPSTANELVEKALTEFGRLDICLTSAAVADPEIFHRTTPENLRAVFEVNVLGTALVASAAMAVMRAAERGCIIMMGSTAGLHGQPTASVYAASKGAVIAMGLTAAAEGANKGVRTNVLLPYAITQMTQGKMDAVIATRMSADVVAPVVGALADPQCTLNGEVIVAGGVGVRAADSIEGATVLLPGGAALSGADLSASLAHSRKGTAHAYRTADAAFQDFAADLIPRI